MKIKLAKYMKSKYWSPAYNSAFGYHQGSFYKALCEAIDRSDKDNYVILQTAYPELCEILNYLNYGCRTDIDKIIKEIEQEDKCNK